MSDNQIKLSAKDRMRKYRAENKELVAEQARAWRAANPERAREHAKRSRIKNKDKVQARQKEWRAKNLEYVQTKSKEYYQKGKDRQRNLTLSRQYGISLDEYEEMLVRQSGACAICGSTDSGAAGKSFSVDHCHESGKVRSLLCRGCNIGVGHFKDDPELLEAAARYIRSHQQGEV